MSALIFLFLTVAAAPAANLHNASEQEQTDAAVLYANLPESAKVPDRLHQMSVAEYVKGKKFICYDRVAKISREYSADALFTVRRSAYKYTASNLSCKVLKETEMADLIIKETVAPVPATGTK
jgi:hypothetical protein